MRLLTVSFAIVVASALASIFLSVRFRLSVKREAPELYEKFWRPAIGSPVLRLGMAVPYAKMIYLRGYRTTLAPYPASRAWASWLSANCLIQLAAVAVVMIVTFSR
jgi:hypothetical protein